jgi:transcriptional regulator with XRE-family HTH domain
MAAASKRSAVLAKTVRTIRKRLGLTQAAFGTLFEVQRNTVLRWEMRLTVPRVGVLFLLLRMADTEAEARPIRDALSGAGVLPGVLTTDLAPTLPNSLQQQPASTSIVPVSCGARQTESAVCAEGNS